MEVGQESFTPLLFTVNRGMAGVFYSKLASLLLTKCGVEKSLVTTWIRTEFNFALLRSMILCLSGTPIATTRNKEHTDIELESTCI